MQRKIVYALLMEAVFVVSLSACSYRQTEEDLKQSLQGMKNAVEYNDSSEQAESIDGLDQIEELEAKPFADKVYQTGETITWTDYSGGKVEYTLETVRTGYNIGDFGVSMDELTDTSKMYISTDGYAQEGANGKTIFVAVDVTVKNIDYEGMAGIGDTPYWLYAEPLIRSQSELEDVDSPAHNMEAVYFSNHSEDIQKYFFYCLAPEQEAEVQLIWIVPETDLQEPLYYVIGSANEQEARQYFQLNE